MRMRERVAVGRRGRGNQMGVWVYALGNMGAGGMGDVIIRDGAR